MGQVWPAPPLEPSSGVRGGTDSALAFVPSDLWLGGGLLHVAISDNSGFPAVVHVPRRGANVGPGAAMLWTSADAGLAASDLVPAQWLAREVPAKK